MNTIIALILIVSGLFVFTLACFRWGVTSNKAVTAENEAKDANEQIEKNNRINSKPFVDKPFSRLRGEK